MVSVLADASLYEYTGGAAPTLAQLQRRYEAQALGQSTDGAKGWFNWIVIRRDSNAPVGFVQATVEQHGPELLADLAWVISPAQQGQGIAAEAARTMASWLGSNGVDGFTAHVHPSHEASMAVARKLALHPTTTVEDGEVRWES